jgi:hypothetical protein
MIIVHRPEDRRSKYLRNVDKFLHISVARNLLEDNRPLYDTVA